MRGSKNCKDCGGRIHLPPGIDPEDALDYCKRCRRQ